MEDYLKKRSGSGLTRSLIIDFNENEENKKKGFSVSPSSSTKIEEIYDDLRQKKDNQRSMNPKSMGTPTGMDRDNFKQFLNNRKQFVEEADPEQLTDEEKKKFMRFNMKAEA